MSADGVCQCRNYCAGHAQLLVPPTELVKAGEKTGIGCNEPHDVNCFPLHSSIQQSESTWISMVNFRSPSRVTCALASTWSEFLRPVFVYLQPKWWRLSGVRLDGSPCRKLEVYSWLLEVQGHRLRSFWRGYPRRWISNRTAQHRVLKPRYWAYKQSAWKCNDTSSNQPVNLLGNFLCEKFHRR